MSAEKWTEALGLAAAWADAKVPVAGTTYAVIEAGDGRRDAAPYSELPRDRDRAIAADPRSLSDFRGLPEGNAFDRAVWLRLMDKGEAQASGLFPTRQEVLEGRGQWSTEASESDEDGP